MYYMGQLSKICLLSFIEIVCVRTNQNLNLYYYFLHWTSSIIYIILHYLLRPIQAMFKLEDKQL